MSGSYAIISEYLGNQFGQYLGLPTQRPHWVSLAHNLPMTNIHVEVRDLVNKSLGLNIGFPFLENSRDCTSTDLQRLTPPQIKDIFLFDIFMINVDRTPHNPNLLWADDHLWSIDYESSLLFPFLLAGKKGLEDPRILAGLRGNPLYSTVEDATINAFLKKVNDIPFEKILSGFPASIWDAAQNEKILDAIAERQAAGWYLSETNRKLAEVNLESEAERKKRIRENQATFKRNLNNRTIED